MKIKILSELNLRPDPDGETFILLSEYIVSINGVIITVPKGYKTDLVSGHRIIRPLVPKWGKHGFGAVVHDYLYDGRGFTRIESDIIFYHIMKHYKTKLLQRLIIFIGVLMFGWMFFNKK
jgi:hypothetical protein